MAIPTVGVSQISNGYIVTLYPQPTTPGTPVLAAPPTEQYCANLTAVAQLLASTFIPGQTVTTTPPPAPPAS